MQSKDEIWLIMVSHHLNISYHIISYHLVSVIQKRTEQNICSLKIVKPSRNIASQIAVLTACDSSVMAGKHLYALSVMCEPHPHGTILGACYQSVTEEQRDSVVSKWSRVGGYDRDDSVYWWGLIGKERIGEKKREEKDTEWQNALKKLK